MEVRTAQETDVPALAAIYISAVQSLGPQYYSARQVASWALFPTESEAFRAFILGCTTYIATDGEQAVGFAGISDEGHVRSLYVHPDRSREGIGTVLMLRMIAHAHRNGLKQLRSEASAFSRPLFLKHGFEEVGTETVVRHGVEFERFLVSRAL